MRKARTLVVDERGDLGGLQTLADHLNAASAGDMSGEYARAWRKAEEILSHAVPASWAPVPGRTLLARLHPPSDLAYSAEAFNRWARTVPAHLEVMRVKVKGGKIGLSPTVHTEGHEGLAAWLVWRLFFVERWQRLKRCPQCRKWFVDKTRNGVMVRCSKSCTDKWWTLLRRQQAGHNVPGSTRRAKRRAKP